MKPVKFIKANTTFGEDQPQYLPLPAHLDDTEFGVLTSCWQLTWRERLKLALLGKVWIQTMTFRQPLQPIKVTLDPDLPVKRDM